MSIFDSEEFLITPTLGGENGTEAVPPTPPSSGDDLPFDLNAAAPSIRTVVTGMLSVYGTWSDVPEDIRSQIEAAVTGSSYNQLPAIEKKLLDMQQTGMFVNGRDVNGKWLSEYRDDLIREAEARGEDPSPNHGPNCTCGQVDNYVTGGLLDLYEVDANFKDLMSGLRSSNLAEAEGCKHMLNMTKIFAARHQTALRALDIDEKTVRYYVRKFLSPALVEGDQDPSI